MSISMYKASAPVFLRMLGNLDAAAGEGRGERQGARLRPQPAGDVASRARHAAALGADPVRQRHVQGRDGASFWRRSRPRWPTPKPRSTELRTRIANTIDYIKSVPASAIDGSEEREVVLKFPNGEMKFKGLDYLTGFALPNFMFHVTTAYAILRHNGVPLGKLDFLGRS